MKLFYRITALAMVVIALSSTSVNAQCLDGEVEVSMTIETDNWGYECYWEIVPVDNGCGDGTIASGGNTAVGCNGGGDQNVNSGGYSNNSTINEGEWCLTVGEEYKLIYVDDWGDGGASFDVEFNGFPLYTFAGSGNGNTWTFTASEPPALDVEIEKSNIFSYTQFGNKFIESEVVNLGTETITSLEYSYSVDGGDWFVQELTGLSLEPLASEHFEHPVAWNEWNGGDYDIEVKFDMPNGSADEDAENNSLTKSTKRGPGTPNIIDQYIGLTPDLVEISSPGDQINYPTDLDFHPNLSRKELWVVNKDTEGTGSSTTIYFDAGEDDQTDIWKRDDNAWHFMSLTTGLAFGENENFGTSPGVFDANHNGGDPFTGPSLWSGDLEIYAEPSGGNGSHLDMLHTSPYSQGIAHEVDNVYWVVDGYNQDVVRYDFAEDHGPGNDFHGDAMITRYADFEIEMDSNNDIVSHCVLQKETNILYVVDHGNARVMSIDITTGNLGGTPSFGPFETYEQYAFVVDYDFSEIISEGLIEPAGIDVIEDRLIVSDHANGDIVIYDLSTDPVEEIGRVETGVSGIMGVKIGPLGRIWYVNAITESVVRIDGVTVGVEEVIEENVISIYPNPASTSLNISLAVETSSMEVVIFDAVGRMVFNQPFNTNKVNIDLAQIDLGSGAYQVVVTANDVIYTETLVVK